MVESPEPPKITGDKSRLLLVGACVIWHADTKDAGTVIEKDWVGVVIKWDNQRNKSFSITIWLR